MQSVSAGQIFIYMIAHARIELCVAPQVTLKPARVLDL